MTSRRTAVLAGAVASWALAFFACVGADPVAKDITIINPDGATPANDGTANANDGDTETDGGPSGDGSNARCNPEGAFGAPAIVANLTSSDDDLGVWISPDEKRAYVTREVAVGGGPDKVRNIRLSTRESRDGEWGPLAETPALDPLNQEGDRFVSAVTLTFDELHMYASSTSVTFHSSRALTTAPFASFVIASSQLDGGGSDLMPGLFPFVARDSSRLYFHVFGASPAIYSAERLGPSLFGAIGRVPSLVTEELVGDEDLMPILTADNTRLYYRTHRNANGRIGQIWMSTRGGDGKFPNGATIGTPNDPIKTDYPASISDDNCVLYFISDRNGGRDVWKTERAK